MFRAASGKESRSTLETGMVFEGQSLHTLPAFNQRHWGAEEKDTETAKGSVGLLTVTRRQGQQPTSHQSLLSAAAARSDLVTNEI